MEAVGETGEGGFPYPAIQRYIRRCGSATHWNGAGAVYGRAGGDDLDGHHDDSDVGNDCYDGVPSGEGGGGRNLEGRRRRRRPDRKSGNNQGWASSSSSDEGQGDHHNEDDVDFDESAFAGAQDSYGVVRSHACPLFVRAPVYFAELLALGRVLYSLHRGGGGAAKGSGRTGANSRARRQATAYSLTVVRMCCDASDGGLDRAEPLGWMGGGRELDEDAAVLQRAQLLVDARLGEKLAPCLHDADPDVKRDAVSCALSALRGGHARLRWISLSVRGAEGVDPRGLLALGFCSTVWVSAFVAMVSGRGAPPAVGSVNPSRTARESEEKVRKMALECLGYMAAAGDLATHNWRGLRVLSALQGLLHRGNTSGMGELTTSRGSAGRGSGSGAGVGETQPELHGRKESVLKILQSLAENGSGETHSMLRAQPGLNGLMRGHQSTPNWESLLTPKGLASTAVELSKGGGTLDEIISLVRRVRSTLATAVRIGDHSVLGATPQVADTGIQEDVGTTLSLVWGWMQRTLVQLARDESDHPSTAARVSLAWECLGLMRFLLGSASACRLAQCKIHPDLAAEASRASPVGGTAPSSRLSDSNGNGHATSTARASSDLAKARTGLETLVLLLSVESPTIDLYRAHPIPQLTAGAADAIADALTYGDRGTVDAVESLGLGVRLGLAVEASARLVRESRRLGVEDVHLLRAYPAGRRARVKLLDRILCQRGNSGSGTGLHAQVIVSGLVEFVASNMLPDLTTTDIVGVRLPASFVRHNGTPLVRNEGVALLERVVARRGDCIAIAREAARQAVRHNVPSAECTRPRENRQRSVRVGVSACLRCLARLDNGAVDRALELAGIPPRAITSARRDNAASKTRRRWARWVRQNGTDAGERPPLLSSQRAPPGVDGLFDGPSPVAPTGADVLQRQDPQMSARISRDLRGLLGPSQQNVDAVPDISKSKGRGEIDAPKHEDRALSPSAAGSFPRDVGRAYDASSLPSAASRKIAAPATEKKMMSAVLTIEGDLSTLSVPTVIALLAAELSAVEESIRLIEIGGSDGVGESGGNGYGGVGSSGAASTKTTAPPVVDHRSILKLSLPGALASQLYTRCLAGVLRVPGLLYLEVSLHGTGCFLERFRPLDAIRADAGVEEDMHCTPCEWNLIQVELVRFKTNRVQVEGKGKLKWTGEEIVPENTDLLHLQLKRPAPSSRPVLPKTFQPFGLPPPARASGTAAPPSEDGFDARTSATSRSSAAKGSDDTRRNVEEKRDPSPRSDRGDDTPSNTSLSWLGRSPSVADRRDSRLDEIAGPDGVGRASGASRVASSAAALSPREQRARVAIALDRMGAAVVEVREAFQRWVPGGEKAVVAARPATSPARRANKKRTVSFSDPNTAEVTAPGDTKATLSNVDGAMVRAMTELRLPFETAEVFCKGAGVQRENGEEILLPVTFSDFVGRYAAASGLLREFSPAGRSGGIEVWVEGPGGAWVAVSRKGYKVARKVFDEQASEHNQDQESKNESDDGGKRAMSTPVVSL